MTHVLFYEPRYDERATAIWQIRGGYKYGSLLGDLHRKASKVTLLMDSVPPRDDPHRRKLEREFGVEFREIVAADVSTPAFADELAGELGAVFGKLKPDVVSNLNGRAVGFQYATALAARRLGTRNVLRIAGNDIEARAKVAEARGTPFYGTISHIRAVKHERVAAHLADDIIVMNKRELRRIASQCADPDKIGICFRGVDQAFFFPTDRPAELCKRFLFVGRQSYEKGFDILEAATDRLAQLNADMTVSFAGTFAPGEKGMRRYLGFVDYERLPATYREHDALVLCSRSEGFPQVIMEAMSCGLPCILTRYLFEQDFDHEVNCLLVEPEPEAVSEAMIRLRDDPELFERLRANSLELAKRDFSEAGNRQRYHFILLDRAS